MPNSCNSENVTVFAVILGVAEELLTEADNFFSLRQILLKESGKSLRSKCNPSIGNDYCIYCYNLTRLDNVEQFHFLSTFKRGEQLVEEDCRKNYLWSKLDIDCREVTVSILYLDGWIYEGVGLRNLKSITLFVL